MKFRNKLLVSFFLASSVPLIIISLIIYLVSADIIENSSRQFASLFLSEVTSSLDKFERDYDQISRLILSESEILRILQEEKIAEMETQIENERIIRVFFTTLKLNYSEILSFILLNDAGQIYSWNSNIATLNRDVLLSQPWFEKIKSDISSAFFISPVHRRSYYSTNQQNVGITVGRKIYSYYGIEIGIILFDLDPSQILRISGDFNKLGLQDDLRLTVTDADDRIIYDSDAVTGKADWNPGLFTENHDVNTRESRDAFLILQKNSGSNRLCSTIEIPISKLLAPLNKVRMVVILLISFWIGAITIFAAKYSANIVKPIYDLQQSMLEVEKENYSALVRLPRSNDEIVSLVKSYNIMIAKIRELIEDVYILDIKQKQARLQALRAQINPHMLYNTLESIRMQAIINGQDSIAEMIKVLARMFKHSLKHQAIVNSIRDELQYVKDYIYIQNIRYGNCFIFEEHLSDKVKAAPVILMSFQPVIEISIIHGFRKNNRALHINISEEMLPGSKVKLIITDDGLGMASDKVRIINAGLKIKSGNLLAIPKDENSSSIGIINIAERLKLKYGNEYYLKVSSEEGKYFRVEFVIPLEE
jgi:two-component system sensor histidine kinase YesM